MSDLGKEKEVAKQIITEIVHQAGGTLVGKASLSIAFYHAHLHFAESQPGYLSAWPIVHRPWGPGIHDLDLVLAELMAEGKVEAKQIASAGCIGFTLRMCDAGAKPSRLPEDAIRSIAYGVQQVVGRSAGQVSRDAHEVSRAWRNSQDGEELNIYTDNIPEDEYRRGVERLKELADAFFDWC